MSERLSLCQQIRIELARLKEAIDTAVKAAEAQVGDETAKRIYEERSEVRAQLYKHLSIEQKLGYYERLCDVLDRRRS